MATLYELLPEVDNQELFYLQKVTSAFDDNQLQKFAVIYRSRRKDPTVILLCTLLGFFSLAGIQRFMTNQIGMGILYLFTGGLCLIGTIIDVVNYQQITLSYNQQAAAEVAMLVK